ncbi:hypothetical protein F2Q68_00013253 [Brassica cretica]|uniref:Uncharacterized protein n=1 Tax=Brassica cretica TaxID=69181 RepID=A0A8S9HHP5_BRACR|nr:hypothetical protein F2Q68_00013253 [Brassica cretica]
MIQSLSSLSESSTLTTLIMTPSLLSLISYEFVPMKPLTQTTMMIPLRISKQTLTLNRLLPWLVLVTQTTSPELLHVVTTNGHLLQHILV